MLKRNWSTTHRENILYHAHVAPRRHDAISQIGDEETVNNYQLSVNS